MHKYNLKMIPLVQTFGHLEFVLKRDRYSHLRETPNNYTSVCPLNPESVELVCSMIDQHMELLSSLHQELGLTPQIPLIHIGADEVFNLATCQSCQFFQEEAGTNALYAKFMRQVCKYVTKTYPETEIMMWDDMFRSWSYQDLQRFRIKGKQVIQPCVWSYCGNAEGFNQTIKNQNLTQLCLEFKSVWAASCFKGACTPSQTLADFHERVYNHKHWLDKVIQNPSCKQAIKGIILTGWSRFTHEMVQCELLCMSIPALALSLTVIEKQCLNVSVIYKEMITSLNIKGRDLFTPQIGDLFQQKLGQSPIEAL